MYDRTFFRTKLGLASLASISAMVTFVALSNQIAASAPVASLAVIQQVSLA